MYFKQGSKKEEACLLERELDNHYGAMMHQLNIKENYVA